MKSEKSPSHDSYHGRVVDTRHDKASTRRKPMRRQQKDVGRCVRMANVFIVAVIVYLILTILSNLYRDCTPAISMPAAERILLSSPSPAYLRNQSRLYTSGAHLAGRNQTQVNLTRDLWESYGIKTELEEYEVLLNYPVSHRLALFENGHLRYEAQLREDVISEDETSINPDVVPTFHGYSANGNVTGELVYANYGAIDDFRLLESKGVNISGKVAIVRYGDTFRGLKVKAAQDFGAIGVIIYSDPSEDKELANEAPYPHGPARHPSAVQRGSVLFLSKLPGDPTTPGYPSKPGVDRIDPREHIPSIPSLPISYRDALPFLKSLNGGNFCISDLGDNWGGSLDGVDYCAENSQNPPIVNLINEVKYEYTPIYNVIGRIPGTLPQEIIVGNHRDAWVYGAGDPVAGSAPLNAVVAAFGRLVKLGWKPLRTIVFASWDAEEYGLVGSTEWVEEHANHLRKYALAYLNVDIGAVGDMLNIQASPLLDDLLIQVTKDVQTNTGDTVYDTWKNLSAGHVEVGVLGSGSDYTGFLQLLGIASSDIGFRPTKAVYPYHSNYDSFYWMDHFGDPGFYHHQQISQMWGLTALRLASSPIVGFNATNYANKLKKYLDSLRSAVLKNASDDVEMTMKGVNFDDLEDAIESLERYAKRLDQKAAELKEHPKRQTCYMHIFCVSRKRTAEVRRVNKEYLEFERIFVGKGLPGRPIYKHVVYAPGTWTGYEGVTFPSIREAIMEHRWEEARNEIREIAKLIKQGSSHRKSKDRT